jgi:tripeptide aminopeptidase
MAHLDTSNGAPGANVKPQVIQQYKGGDIPLPGVPGKVIPEDHHLKDCIGHTLVTSDGTTLLGGDDKSGIAAIMTALQTLTNDPKILHGDVKICFTPDEEIGEGADHFDVKKFGAKYAYTLDGEFLGELNNETFSANGGTITIQGHNTHPGYAKNIMVNAIKVAADVVARLPKHTSPETTENYEPYLHPMNIEGNEEKATIKWLFRDFKTDGLIDLQKILEKVIADVQKDHPKAKITLEVKEQYRNMIEKLKTTPEVLDCLEKAVKRSGIKPVWRPIRGGTDGARLTKMGLPTPNFFGGFYNYHSTTEWASVNVMEAASKVVLNVLQVWLEKSR